MIEIDFITAFGRLLRDGRLRDAFAASPQATAKQVQLRPSDLPFWVQLVPEDVEFQATVLLHKRLDLVKYFAPETCCRTGERLWPIFQNYARFNWPPDGRGIYDAFQFCRHLKKHTSGAVAASEWNRLDFVFSRHRVALHWVELPTVKKRNRRGFQLFLRGPGRRWREFFFYFGL